MSKVFEKILCPVGFDQNSVAAVEFACELAEPNLSRLYLLHVVSAPRIERTLLKPNPIISEGVATRELEKLAQQHVSDDIRHQIVVRTGDPAGSIVLVAEELGVDLIVMPTHGEHGFARMITGSVAERVVREARRHVLTFRGSSAP
ncbi:MAG TPA: universal stress protein [Candidatus Binataceae bacterium]|nr:universal stress protein [Candidatus Binataceae bacterium]